MHRSPPDYIYGVFYRLDSEQNEHGFDYKIQQLLEPIVNDCAVELLKVHIGSSGHKQNLRVIIDRRGGVDSRVLERISRALALQLDVEDLFRGEYQLEVSSPGFSWMLETQADFSRYLDEWIRLDFHDGKSIEGKNLGLLEECVQIQEKKKKPASYPQSDLRKVTRSIDWATVSRRGE